MLIVWVLTSKDIGSIFLQNVIYLHGVTNWKTNIRIFTAVKLLISHHMLWLRLLLKTVNNFPLVLNVYETWILMKMLAFCHISPCSLDEVDWHFRRACCLHSSDHTSETSVYFNEITRRYIPEGNRLHICRRENLKSHMVSCWLLVTLTVWYRTKRPIQLRSFCDQLCFPRELQSFPICPPDFSALIAAETPSSEAERNWARNGRWILPISTSIIPQVI
jgi:hypothetical protein